MCEGLLNLMIIYPSILTPSVEIAQEQLDRVARKVKVAQIDVVDGKFADNTTIQPADLKKLVLGDTLLDIHLMTVDPLANVFECAGLPSVRMILAQIEHMSSQQEFIAKMKNAGWKVGLSLDLETPLSVIEKASWGAIDALQIMSIHAGFQGQEFEPSALEKIQQAKNLMIQNGASIELIADGGINTKTVRLCATAGADACTVGSFLWHADNIDDALAALTS